MTWLFVTDSEIPIINGGDRSADEKIKDENLVADK